MSKLDELEEDLYGNDPSQAASRRRPGMPLDASRATVRRGWEDATPPSAAAPRGGMKKIFMIAVAGTALFVAGGVVFVYFYLGADRHEVEVTVGGPDSIEAGQLVTVPISAHNISGGDLDDVDLALTIPPDAMVRDTSGLERAAEPRMLIHIGTLEADGRWTQEVTLRLFGHEGEADEIMASLLYRPEKLSAKFSSQEKKQIIISRVPLELFWDVPETIIARQPVKMTLRLSSQAAIPFGGLWTRLDYPPGFTLASANPQPTADNTLWKVSSLDSGKEETIVLTGSFDGTGGEVKALRAGLGSFNELTKEWKPWRESSKEVTLSSSPFLLTAAVQGRRDGVIRPGDHVDIVVHYENKSPVPVKNISVQARVEGGIIDVPTMAIQNGGVFDSAARAVVWGPGGTPQLREVAPGAGGDLVISVMAKSPPVMHSTGDENLTMSVIAGITSADAPEELKGVALSPEDKVIVKVATMVLVSGRAVFRSSPLLNTGPLPPRVGQKTAYTIIWEARNFTNDIENAEIRAPLPPNIRWVGATFPASAQVSFDAAASEVRWRIGRLAAGTGVIVPSLTAAFQVSVVPASVDVGKPLTLTGEAQFAGRDTFIGEDAAGRIGAFTTELSDDPGTTPGDWRVVK